MHPWSRLMSRREEAGFTLAEILVACAVISVGLIAVATGFGIGVDGVEAGRQQSTALFLAEQRIEQVRALALQPPLLLANVNSTNLPSPENYGYSGTLPGAPKGYWRTTTITNNPAGVSGARVDVTVYYRPVTGRGVLTTERSVSLSIFLANR